MAEDQRDFKTKHEHWEIVINYLEEYPNLLRGKFEHHDHDAINLKNIWEKMVNHLNSLGYGQKSTEKWQLAIGRWKSKVKHKAAALRLEMERTGGGPPTKPPLTDVEERLMKILGWKSIMGDKNREFGIICEKNRCNAEDPGSSQLGGSSKVEAIPSEKNSIKKPIHEETCIKTSTEILHKPDDIPSLHFFKAPNNKHENGLIASKEVNNSVCTKRRIPLRTDRSKKMVTLSTMHMEQLTVLKNIEKGVGNFTKCFSEFRDDFKEYLQILKQKEGTKN